MFAHMATLPENTLSGRKILIVDDNRDAAKTLATLLSMGGNETHTAHDGEEALAMAAAIRPDISIIDIGLPKMSGYEVCRALREQDWGQSMALVAVTGRGEDDDLRKSQESGFNGHLTKPVDFRELTKFLARLLADPLRKFQV
jgi:CheY-like chemotaxis protein